MHIDPSDLLYAVPATILRTGQNDALAILATGTMTYVASQELAVTRGASECVAAGRLISGLIVAGTFRSDADGYFAIGRLLDAGLLRRVPVLSLPREHGRALDTIGIPTADRPEYLSRCLRTLDDHCQAFGRGVSVVVVDGSRDPEAAARNRAVARLYGLRGRVRATYIGTAEARQMAQILAPVGLSESTWKRALIPGQFGANRNLLLLLTAGRRILMCDDDVCWDTWSSRRSDDTAFWSHRHDAVTEPLGSRDEARHLAGTYPRGDLLADHGALLGQSVGALTSTTNSPEGMCCHLADRLASSDTNIAATFSGIAGDSAIRCPYAWLLTDNPLRRRMVLDNRICSAVLSSREVLRGVDQPSVLHGGPVMGYCTGFANTEALVPFAPIGRNEDGVFGCLMMATRPGVTYAFVPSGIIHDSPRGSAYDPAAIVSAGPLRVADIFIAAIERFAMSGSGTSGLTLHACGEGFLDFAAHEPADRASGILRDVWSDRLRTTIKAEAEMRRDYGSPPDHIQQAFGRYRAALRATAKGHPEVAPVEFGGAGSDPVAVTRELNSWLWAYGDLMTGWRELWQAARRMELVSILAASPRASPS